MSTFFCNTYKIVHLCNRTYEKEVKKWKSLEQLNEIATGGTEAQKSYFSFFGASPIVRLD